MSVTSDVSDGTHLDGRDPQVRLRALFDRGSCRTISGGDDSGVHSARGEIDGTTAIAFATDPNRLGGALGTKGCHHIVDAIDAAVRERVPVVGLWHSDGPRLAEGAGVLDAVGQVFAAMVRASGRVPQLSVVLGPAAGGAAYGPALSDIVIRGAQGRLFATGPAAAGAPGPEPARAPLPEAARIGSHPAAGGPHGRAPAAEPAGEAAPDGPSGVVHVNTPDDASALATARTLAGLLGRQGRISPADTEGAGHDLAALVPVEGNRTYDVRPVVAALLDQPGVELHAGWAPNIVTTLGRFTGRTIGVIANNPRRLGGCLDAAAAEKAARFVRMCDALGVPLVVLVDVPGYLPGVGPDHDAVLRRGAALLHAFAEAVVPRVTVVTRRAYGGAAIAMNSRSLGATAVFAWPGAEVAVTSAEAAVDLHHRRTLAAAAPGARDELRARLVAEQRVAGGADRALDIGVIDGVIAPADTRRRVAEALADAPAARGAHGNIPL